MTCAAISEAGRPGSSLLMMRAVAMPGQTGGPCSGGPPLHQGRETLLGRAAPPVKLRSQIIHPSFGKPFAGVAGQVLVGIHSGLDSGRHARAPDAERLMPTRTHGLEDLTDLYMSCTKSSM